MQSHISQGNIDHTQGWRNLWKRNWREYHEVISQGAINLRRLFHEILSRMLKSLKNRMMSEEEFSEISRMIEILFSSGIMLYTDPNRFVHDFSRLQTTINETLKSSQVILINNRLFTLMKDKAIQYQDIRKRKIIGNYNTGRNRIHDFLVQTTNYGGAGEDALERVIRQIHKIGFRNAALYLYEWPIDCPGGEPGRLPDTMRLRCVIRNGELFPIPAERQSCPVTEIYSRSELPAERLGYITYPLFCGKTLYGLLVCGAEAELYEIGEFLTFQLSGAISMNWGMPAES